MHFAVKSPIDLKGTNMRELSLATYPLQSLSFALLTGKGSVKKASCDEDISLKYAFCGEIANRFKRNQYDRTEFSF